MLWESHAFHSIIYCVDCVSPGPPLEHWHTHTPPALDRSRLHAHTAVHGGERDIKPSRLSTFSWLDSPLESDLSRGHWRQWGRVEVAVMGAPSPPSMWALIAKGPPKLNCLLSTSHFDGRRQCWNVAIKQAWSNSIRITVYKCELYTLFWFHLMHGKYIQNKRAGDRRNEQVSAYPWTAQVKTERDDICPKINTVSLSSPLLGHITRLFMQLDTEICIG